MGTGGRSLTPPPRPTAPARGEPGPCASASQAVSRRPPSPSGDPSCGSPVWVPQHFQRGNNDALRPGRARRPGAGRERTGRGGRARGPRPPGAAPGRSGLQPGRLSPRGPLLAASSAASRRPASESLGQSGNSGWAALGTKSFWSWPGNCPGDREEEGGSPAGGPELLSARIGSLACVSFKKKKR